MANIKVIQARSFAKAVKKLKPNQKLDLDKAVKHLLEHPLAGELKKGDLSYLRVYKFQMVNQLSLLGYSYQDEQLVLELINVGSHENFYRDLKR